MTEAGGGEPDATDHHAPEKLLLLTGPKTKDRTTYRLEDGTEVRVAETHNVEQQSGFIGSVSSMASIDPFPGFSIYAAAKAGVNLFTLVTGREGQKIGVRAMAVAPGAVETGMLRKLFDESVIPADATLSPDEVAKVIVDCLENKRAFEVGQTIELPSP